MRTAKLEYVAVSYTVCGDNGVYGVPKHHEQAPKAARKLLIGRRSIKTYAYLNARANFAGFNAIKGSVMKATKKQTAAPNRQAPNPSSLSGDVVRRDKEKWGLNAYLSHRDNANHASSSLERSLDRRGM